MQRRHPDPLAERESTTAVRWHRTLTGRGLACSGTMVGVEHRVAVPGRPPFHLVCPCGRPGHDGSCRASMQVRGSRRLLTPLAVPLHARPRPQLPGCHRLRPDQSAMAVGCFPWERLARRPRPRSAGRASLCRATPQV